MPGRKRAVPGGSGCWPRARQEGGSTEVGLSPAVLSSRGRDFRAEHASWSSSTQEKGEQLRLAASPVSLGEGS